MFSSSVIVLAFLSLAAGYVIREDASRPDRDAPYRGPPAPLNHDGTVAFTPEFLQANDIHNAAYAEEYQRLQAAADLAAAHPDRTSPPSKDYNPQDNGQYNHQTGQLAHQQQDDGQYRPHIYENQESNQQYSSPVYVSQQSEVSYNQEATHQHYNPVNYNAATYQPTTQQQYNPVPQNQQHHAPAPLNPDGTVAQTPEYNALAASLHNSYQQALTRHRRSLNHYHVVPAPLNHDGTVANTPEIEHAIAAHKAAYALQYQKLHEAEILAAAHPDLSYYEHYEAHSGSQDDGMYNVHVYDNGDYNFNQNNKDSTMHYSPAPSKYNPEAHIPAPLNHDGTVAHTAEYKAIAASHQAEHQKALQSTKYHMMTPEYQHGSAFSDSYW